MREARRQNKQAVVVVDKLYIHNDLYATPSDEEGEETEQTGRGGGRQTIHTQ